VANHAAIASAMRSIERLLAASFRDLDLGTSATTAKIVRTEDLVTRTDGTAGGPPSQGVSLFVYRVECNKVMRAAWSSVSSVDGRVHLPIDVHFLLTAWASDAVFEHTILGRSLEALEQTPILSGPLLEGSGGWTANEAVQIHQEELGVEAVMRTFDSLPVDFKLSLAYVARIVRLDGARATPTPPVRTAILGRSPEGTP
jgi:hypothetical protein